MDRHLINVFCVLVVIPPIEYCTVHRICTRAALLCSLLSESAFELGCTTQSRQRAPRICMGSASSSCSRTRQHSGVYSRLDGLRERVQLGAEPLPLIRHRCTSATLGEEEIVFSTMRCLRLRAPRTNPGRWRPKPMDRTEAGHHTHGIIHHLGLSLPTEMIGTALSCISAANARPQWHQR